MDGDLRTGDGLEPRAPEGLEVEGQVLFWATLNPFGVRIKAISSEVAFFVFWCQKGNDASIDAFSFIIMLWNVENLHQ
jgi:hypothetical protein